MTKSKIILSLEEVLKRIRMNKEKLKEFGVKETGIFGSLVREELKENSDLDLIVIFEEGKKSFRNYFGLLDFLEEIFFLDIKIDLLTKEGISPYIWPYIEKEIIYEKL